MHTALFLFLCLSVSLSLCLSVSLSLCLSSSVCFFFSLLLFFSLFLSLSSLLPFLSFSLLLHLQWVPERNLSVRCTKQSGCLCWLLRHTQIACDKAFSLRALFLKSSSPLISLYWRPVLSPFRSFFPLHRGLVLVLALTFLDFF